MSFDIALSGIQAINEQLGTTSNNIANAGTYGFKSSRANFASQYAGDQATGVKVGSITQSIGLNGGVVNTGRGLDAAINGRGFFVTKDMQGQNNYTRVGIFNADTNGFLVDSTGRKVQGFAITPPSTTLGPMGDLVVPTGQIPAVPSTKLNYVSNLSDDWEIPAATPAFAPPDLTTSPQTFPEPTSYNMSRVSVLYDSKGNQHSLTQYFIKTGASTVDVIYTLNGLDLSQPKTLTFDSKGQLPSADPTNALHDLAGILPQVYDPVSNTYITTEADDMAIKIDYNGTTLAAGEATNSTNKADGYASGTFIGVELAKDGSLVAKYSNDQRQSVGKLVIATFADEGALTPISDTSWLASNASGTPLYGTPGNGTAGALSTSALEQSNVDITSELVSLMTSQRNYQANSKVIQTESAMMQSLMQAM